MSEIRKRIRNFVVNNFLFGEEGNLSEEASFLDEGIIDSTGILELVEFLEEEFAIRVGDDELIPENLDSIARVENYLMRKLRKKGGDAPAAVSIQLGA